MAGYFGMLILLVLIVYKVIWPKFYQQMDRKKQKKEDEGEALEFIDRKFI